MKNLFLSLLILILLVALANLLVGVGIIGAGAAPASSYEYQTLNGAQMDNIGFRSVAKEEGIEVTEEGEITFPKEMVDKIAKVSLLPRTIQEVEKDGGWEYVGATSDDHYIFRRAK